jgi:L-aspartate oxidase
VTATETGIDLIPADVVVVGAGVAGLTAALGLAPRRVVLLTKARLGAGGASVWAQGGVAAAMGPDDEPGLHARDTLQAAAGIADPEVVELLTREGPLQIERLIELGARFDRDAAGELALGREGAHGKRRILHAQGDATGAEMVRALTDNLRHTAGIQVFEHAFAADLVLANGRIAGVTARLEDGRSVLFATPAVVLATGGIGRLYSCTTNPVESTGDGLAMAARAGARLADLEFVQFHPTALATGADPMPLLTEALRGEGAVLIDEHGARFMPGEHPQEELAPRDVVARAIWRRLEAGHTIYLDAREAVGERFPDRFPTVFKLCRNAGLDPRRQAIPVAPAAHYHMGGVAVDDSGRSSLAGLWAAGEVSSTGVHGANRLASNSLLEALVFGARVAEAIGGSALAATSEARARLAVALPPARRHGGGDGDVVPALRQEMWSHAGLVRERPGLEHALSRLQAWRARPDLGGEARNLADVGVLVARAALERRESRGGHYRSDYPTPEPALQHRRFWLGFEPEPAQPLAAEGGR